MISNRVKSLSPYKTETTHAPIRLSSNELSLELPDFVKRRIGEEISKLSLNRYPDPEAKLLKEAIAQRFGLKVENLLLGNGSDELIYYLSMAIGEFDKGVFYPVPTFSMYGISAQVLGRERIEVKLKDDFDIDLSESIYRIEEKGPALAYFAYPNNPTGNCFSEEKIKAIRNMKLFTVIDEAYYHYSEKTFLKDALEREDTVVLRSLSKIGLAGLRIGFMVGREDLISEINKIRLPFNVTLPSQVIARLMLDEFYHILEEEIETAKKERDRVYKELSKMEGIAVYPSKANFILFKSLVMPADIMHRRLVQEGVLIRNFSYMIPDSLRVTVGRAWENDAFLEAIQKILNTP
ncbi:MAG: histidinol-phosphate transaminase [Aquificaceae bacterium]|nr:histidinol-phosphate transaminase [Aquificaceae bacterium]